MDREGDITNTFKTAANSVTLLYKESLAHSKKAFDSGYESGYQQAMSDLWNYIANTAAVSKTVTIAELSSFFESRNLLPPNSVIPSQPAITNPFINGPYNTNSVPGPELISPLRQPPLHPSAIEKSQWGDAVEDIPGHEFTLPKKRQRRDEMSE